MSDLWDLALKSADVLRFSTLFTAQQVPQYLADDGATDAAIEWCRAHAVTHVYLESFRSEFVTPPELIERAAERFRAARLPRHGLHHAVQLRPQQQPLEALLVLHGGGDPTRAAGDERGRGAALRRRDD